MVENFERDAAALPDRRRDVSGCREYFVAARGALMAGRRVRGRAPAQVQAAIGHALAFASWRSLAIEQGLDDDEAAELMRRLVAAAA